MLIYLAMIDSPQDQEKFIEIYKKYKGMMFSVASDILKNREDAEDAVHQAFLYVITNLNKIEAGDSQKTRSYLMIISEHQAIDILRKKNRQAALMPDAAPEARWQTVPSEQELSDLILRLKPLYREVLFLRYYHGFTEKEIARQLDMKYDNIRKIIQRAKTALKDLMNEDDI